MKRAAASRKVPPTVPRLRKTLKILSETPASFSYREAKQYVCSVCNLPVKPCEGDSRATCFHMMREGTELQSLFTAEQERSRHCVSCGRAIPKKSLRMNPNVDLCPACTTKSKKMKTPVRPKGNPL